jgi:hypothetical protein
LPPPVRFSAFDPAVRVALAVPAGPAVVSCFERLSRRFQDGTIYSNKLGFLCQYKSRIMTKSNERFFGRGMHHSKWLTKQTHKGYNMTIKKVLLIGVCDTTSAIASRAYSNRRTLCYEGRRLLLFCLHKQAYDANHYKTELKQICVCNHSYHLLSPGGGRRERSLPPPELRGDRLSVSH